MQHTLSTCVSGPSPVWLQAAFPVLFPGTSYSRSLQLQQNHHSSQNLPPCQQLRPGLTETFALASPKWTYPCGPICDGLRRSSSCCPWFCYPHPVCTALNAACRPQPSPYLQHAFQLLEGDKCALLISQSPMAEGWCLPQSQVQGLSVPRSVEEWRCLKPGCF